ncbi:hypothetical protein AM501_05350 [Aneurinibacillus migulanus]|uniref:hypothetical protein n=1 Tax=Aneurinibacillus migulanus TaxID=47500 RepID=UPI0005BCDDE1|nr:hypothetical protein [Aneurinibacillus migulanus]KIV58567.1 hypothetical protein TS64_04265 [Aneurinibacillus migulanus]KPD09261.1 hypothetical protein AM501_05350 [Aneurinibacillus migulanus]
MKKIAYIAWVFLAIVVGIKVIFYTRFDFHFSVQAAVITVAIVCPVIFGTIAGIRAIFRHRPTVNSDAWKYLPAEQTQVFNEEVEEQQAAEAIVTSEALVISTPITAAEEIEELTDVRPVDSLTEPCDMHVEETYETSAPANDMQGALNELLLAIEKETDKNKRSEMLPNERVGVVPVYGDEPQHPEVSDKDFEVYKDELASWNSFLESGPSILPINEFRAIKEKYGSHIASQITTTPAEGPQGMVDIMIGRLVERAEKINLAYGGYHVALTGNVPDEHTGCPILVKGQFVTHEMFYVTSWDIPQEGGSFVIFTDEEIIAYA